MTEEKRLELVKIANADTISGSVQKPLDVKDDTDPDAGNLNFDHE